MRPTREQFIRLAQTIRPGSKLLGIRPLSGGMSAQMTAFGLENDVGQKETFIWRSYQPTPLEPILSPIAREFQLLQVARSVGLAVPTPHFLDLSGEIFAEPYLIIDYIAGNMLFAPADVADYLRQFAAHLARIHMADYANHDLSFLPKLVGGCQELSAERPFSHPFFPESQIRQILATYSPFTSHNPSTLLHGDYWPGNTLWRNNALTAVIDWEDAAWGDPLLDLAQSRGEIVWLFGIAAMNSFTAHYQTLVALDYTHLPYWDLCAALRFIRLFGHNLAEASAYFVPFGRDDMNEQTIRENMSYFMEQALAKVTP